MLDSFLSCRTFALPEDRAVRCVDLARRWSGNERLTAAPDGSLGWVGQTTVDVEADKWRSAKSNWTIQTRNSLIPLGKIGDDQAFVFVSPNSGFSSAFRAALLPFIEESGNNNTRVKALALNLDNLIKDPPEGLFRDLRGFEGFNAVGDKITTAIFPSSVAKRRIPEPTIVSWCTIKVEVTGKLATIDTNFDMKLEGVLNSSAADVTSCLSGVFDRFRDRITVKKMARANTFG